MTTYTQEAETAARIAGSFLIKNRPNTQHLPTDAMIKDFLSDADGKADQMIRESLAKSFNIPYGSEETGHIENTSLRWNVDPIDGTQNFALGSDNWSVSIALLNGTKVVAAALYFPMLNDMFTLKTEAGQVGATAYRNGEKFTVTPEARVPQITRFHVAWTKRGHNELGRDLEVTRCLFNKTTYVANTVCGTYDIRAILLGHASGLAFRRPGREDMAAAAAIAQAAGCHVTDFDGEPWSVDSSVLCTRLSLGQHKDIITALKGV